MTDSEKLSAKTLAAQAMGHIDEATRGLVPPVHLTTTFIRDPDNKYSSGNIYGRPDNETVREGEAVIAALEGAQSALLFGSGMSAAIALFLSLGAGAHVIAPAAMYWSLRNWLSKEAPSHGIAVDIVDATNLDAIGAAVRPGQTKLIWLETPSNPLWSLSDIAGAATIAHAAGARLAVDSTCATPVFTQPLALGADVVMHSATKYLNGHSDVIAGALAFARNEEAARVREIRASHGMILGPFEAYLLIRGMRTLDLRVRACAANASELGVDFLTIHGHDTKTMKAAVAGRGKSKLKLLAVTVLTHLSRQDLSEQMISADPASLVLHRARLAKDAGCDGVICSANEAREIRQAVGKDFLIVTPGIRLPDDEKGDQVRVTTPEIAIEAGADYLVVGRPITQAKDPKQAATNFSNAISSTLTRCR